MCMVVTMNIKRKGGDEIFEFKEVGCEPGCLLDRLGWRATYDGKLAGVKERWGGKDFNTHAW
ncbi:hypothetical protein Cflav_PD5347 [Pedosphaera parvula Ellin514]|uniref:Uncharacterized protein n=2 Tax=Pedosphaera TaxID=1032526 RepID=B9XB27_PEDPL|nr:hypothetical protein Cflav_PD5347 [Pedosphaera parvula Ellin514]